MRIRFWGTRGSLPVATYGSAWRRRLHRALQQAADRTFTDADDIDRFIDNELDFVTRHGFGGNTSCVQIDCGNAEYLICDMGSGLREFGQHVMATHGPGTPQVYNFLLSHVHWDHIMGFPFFPPAYIPGNTIRIHGCHPIEVLEKALRRQHSDPSFPVDYKLLGSTIEYVQLETGRSYEIGGLSVSAHPQPHHGDSFGYRLEHQNKTAIYTTDAEHKPGNTQEADQFVEFLRGADLVIFDAMYSLADMITIRQDWGHSSNTIGVDLCRRADARHLVLFHHEPAHDDETIAAVLQETIRYEELTREQGPPLAVSAAFDGREIEL